MKMCGVFFKTLLILFKKKKKIFNKVPCKALVLNNRHLYTQLIFYDRSVENNCTEPLPVVSNKVGGILGHLKGISTGYAICKNVIYDDA